MLREGLATKQDLLYWLPTQRYDTNTRFFIVYHTLFNHNSTFARTGSWVSWNREVGVPNNPLPRLTQMLRYKDFSTLDDIKIEKIN